MRAFQVRPILMAAAFALASCGGGGGSALVTPGSVPPPTTTAPPPPQAPATPPLIIPAAATNQQFAAMGATDSFSAGQSPRLDSENQLQVRYLASTNSYEVQVPGSQAWSGISYIFTGSGTPINFGNDAAHLWLRSAGYQYSSLFEWSANNSIYGHEAIGMATPAGGVPVTGSATYLGQILGSTSEIHFPDDMGIDGSISMRFNFGAGTLSGSITPNLRQDFASFSLGTLNFRDTVYAAGSPTFSGKFDTNLAGINGFGGQFTGPNAQELIGNFAFPYQSPIDNQTYQADGAFVGRGGATTNRTSP